MPLHVQVITPEKTVLDEDVDELIVPTTSGEITVLPEHIGLFSEISHGELVMKKSGRSEYFAVLGGFLEVSKNIATVLADYAVNAKEISEAEAQKAKERAEKAMKEKTSEKDYALAQSEFARAILELKVAKRIKSIPRS